MLVGIGVSPDFAIGTLYDGVYKFALLAVPFFLFAGALVEKTSFSNVLIQHTLKWTTRIRGGVPLSGVIANEFFGAISGSSAAATGTVGKLLYPTISENQGESFSLGILTSAGALAIIMPPSITMILYGAVVNVSVGKLFITGIIPAIVVGAILGLYIIWRSRPVSEVAAGSEMIGDLRFSFKNVISVSCTYFLPVLILGGIYGGFFTPTESSAVAVFYVVLVSYVLLRELSLRVILTALSDTLVLTTQIFVVVAASMVFSQTLTMAQVPQQLASICEALSPSFFLVILNLTLLFTGMFFDPNSAVLVLAPLVAPIAQALGIDLIHLGLVFTVNIAIGMFTPPFGLNLFVSQAVFNKPLQTIVETLVPFWLLYLCALVIITFLPGIYMWVPNMLLK
jgi:C4-dicarboxylate transporter DctM subunit